MKSKSNKKTSSKALLTSLPGFKFLNEVDSELRKVTWPNRKKVIRMSVIVVIVSLVIGLYLGALDFAFTSLMGFLLGLKN